MKTLFQTYFTTLLLVVYFLTGHAQPGQLITSFGVGGAFRLDVGDDFGIFQDLVVLNNGDVVAVGESRLNNSADFVVVKVDQNGKIVKDFGLEGVIREDINQSNDVAVSVSKDLSDNLYVAVTTYFPTLFTSRAAIYKYNFQGILDTNFANQGVFVFETEHGGWTINLVEVHEGGSIFGAVEGHGLIGIFKLDEAGRLDSTFAGKGYLTLQHQNQFRRIKAMAFQDDFKVIMTGEGRTQEVDWKYFLLRIDGDGNIDSTFAHMGFLVDSVFAHRTYGQDVAVQPDGKIVMAGYHNDMLQNEVLLMRMHNNGQMDNTFGLNGVFKQPALGSTLQSVLLEAGNDVIAGGDNAILRVQANGTLDSNFGFNGIATTGVGLLITKLAFDNHQNICAVGFIGQDLGIAKYASDISSNADVISNKTNHSAVRIYPNPTTGTVHLDLAFIDPERLKISILNHHGQEIQSFYSQTARLGLNKERIKFDSELPTGLYYIRVRNDKGVWLRKIVKH